MSEAKFTPGPWLKQKREGYEQYEIGLSDRLTIMGLSGCREGSERYMLVSGCIDQHDAALIAAAPDLYAAADRALAWWRTEGKHKFDGAPECMFALDLALSKARGET